MVREEVFFFGRGGRGVFFSKGGEEVEESGGGGRGRF